MGRLWSRIKQGVKKVGRFIGRVADKVGNVAGVLSNVPVIGSVASTVARGANLVSKIGNGAANLVEKGEQIRQKYQPTIDKVKEAGKAIHQSGIPDKLTRGGFTRVINKLKHHRDRIEQRGNQMMDRAERHGQRIGGGINRGLEQVATHGNRIRAAIEKTGLNDIKTLRRVGDAQRTAPAPG